MPLFLCFVVGVSTMLNRTWLVLSPLVAAALSATLTAAPPSDSAARLAIYEAATGESYFARSVVPQVSTATRPTDIVVLFDTSARQAGRFREEAFATLKSILQTLDPADRVKLVAVDLRAKDMTPGFVSPEG